MTEDEQWREWRLNSLLELVGEMRRAQREYSATRLPGALRRSRELERQVDTCVKIFKKERPEQGEELPFSRPPEEEKR